MENNKLIAKQKAFFAKLEEVLENDTVKHRGLSRDDAEWWFCGTFDNEPLMNLRRDNEVGKAFSRGEPVTAFDIETPDDYCLTVRLKICNAEFYLYRIEDDVKWVFGDIDNYEDLDERDHMQEAANKLKIYLEDDLKKAGLKTEVNG